MEIKREQIEERLKLLEQNREQLQANINATEGAIQDCRYWLEKLEEADNGE